jgi:hypothetical protein
MPVANRLIPDWDGRSAINSTLVQKLFSHTLLQEVEV